MNLMNNVGDKISAHITKNIYVKVYDNVYLDVNGISNNKLLLLSDQTSIHPIVGLVSTQIPDQLCVEFCN
jgi:hypothetical protein